MNKFPLAAIVVLILAIAPGTSGADKPAPKKTARSAAQRWLNTLTLRQKVAQLIVIPFTGEAPNTRSRQYRQFVRLVRDQQVGGLILISRTARGIRRAEPYALAAFLNRMQRMARIPLLVSADFERGASMRVESTTLFPHAMAFAAAGDPQATRFMGETTARDARALGVHWVFFPVADVNNNPDNPIINIRSFGESPRDVSAHVRAFIDGAKADPKSRVLTTAKHFPGHGDTAVDSHLAMPSIPANREHLENVEFPPFRAAIEEGVDSVMTAHISVPAIEDPELPATLSSKILTGILRDEWKFQGLIVTDALEMGGVAKGYSNGEAAVRSLEAGADVLLMPADPEAAIRAVVAAVRSKRLSVKRIDQSVARILAAKQAAGLDRGKLVNLEAIADVVNSPEAAARAQEIADKSVTLVKNEGGAVPLRNPGRACFFVLPESRESIQGEALLLELRQRSTASQVFTVDPAMPDADIEITALQGAVCEQVVVMAFASLATYRDGQVLPGVFPRLIETLLKGNRPVTLVSMGSPYLVRNFPKVAAYLTTYSPVAPAEVAAVKALFGEIDINGRLPVTIPGVADFGFGISVSRTAK